ncbi:hypothetical protein LEP1GSC107_3043 [Leptospira interrogans serovar Grippotyphosa str. UI 12769]|nr:hypothetical protein LEP1GSC009_0987 [Leptospira interrogans serovar Grippotyphosa str. Andaman]EKP84573.1 hypothetical protein LEP1GSC020_4490 [Leptospira interrogans serovar Grippotyphosa str. 2006006986]EKR45261.1 hypothetical protein LEP1GSC097_3439 [Leptospira interrogans serovar Grippotyphosa str. UI 08368]EMN85841.1 hypothetical protein LEP1GSC107_3043 [Leptospira interrogans serovar Grippotyphosa str. UI 12769]
MRCWKADWQGFKTFFHLLEVLKRDVSSRKKFLKTEIPTFTVMIYA